MIKKFSKHVIIAVLVLIAGISIAGCKKENGSDTGNDNNPVKSTEKTVGGEIKIATKQVTTLNPIANNDRDVDQMLKLIYDPLVKLDENLKVSPYLAESVTVDPTGNAIDVVLRQDVKWHNGDTLNSDDLVHTLDLIKKADDSSAYKSRIAGISTYKKIDEKTVRIYTRVVYSNPLYSLYFPVVHRSAGVALDDKAIGTGRYKIDSLSQMQELRLVRNADYFNNPAYIETIRVMMVPDKKTELQAFRQKQIDIMFTEDMIAGQYNGNSSVEMMQYSTMNYDFLAFNFKNELLANDELRRIIAHSIDKKDIIMKVYYNYAKEAQTMIHPNSYLYNPSTTSYEYNLSIAKNLLRNATFPKENLSFKLLVNSENSERMEVAQIVKNNLKEVGIEIVIDALSFDDYMNKINSKDFDLLIGGWHLLIDQDISFALHSSQINGGKNYISYNDAEMDGILQSAYTQLNEASVKSEFTRMQEYIVSKVPYLGLLFRENVGYLNKDKISGVLKPLEHDYYNGIENLYVVTK